MIFTFRRRYLEGVFEELWNDSSNGDGNNVTRANGDENNTMPVEVSIFIWFYCLLVVVCF